MKFHHAWNVVLFGILCAVAASANVEAATYRMTVQSVAEAGGKCVSAANGQFVEGMRVFIWDCSAPLAKTLVYDDQTQQLKFGANCVEVLGQGNARDAVGVGACSGSASQHWSMAPIKDNYQIIGVNSLCLAISGGVTADGTPLELAACAATSVAQLWQLLQASDAPAAQAAPVPAPAAAVTVQSLFERRGLMGTFAEDCSKDPGDSNQYIVHRVLDAAHVERDQMKSRTVRTYAAYVESADELASKDVAMNILIVETTIAQMKDWRMHLETRTDGNRIRLMVSSPLSGPYAGQANVTGGRAANGGGETHWLTKCQ